MTTAYDFSHLGADEIATLIIAASNSTTLNELMASVAQCRPSGPLADGIDWRDRFGWTALSRTDFMNLLADFWTASGAALAEHTKRISPSEDNQS
jgi:hypothetical protein